MASLRLGLKLLKRPTLYSRISPVCNVLARSASDGGPPPPPIKPPGPEWIPGKWKDDGTGYGDYPNYVEWSYQNRDPDPVEPYFDKQDRRYFGEPVHVNDDVLNMWMPDSTDEFKYTPREMLVQLMIAFGCIGALVWYSEYVYDAPSKDPAAPKAYPYNNLYIERGGDPNKEPTEADLKARIPRPHFGW